MAETELSTLSKPKILIDIIYTQITPELHSSQIHQTFLHRYTQGQKVII